jgi:SAM-dependent methyltransferase
MAGLAESNGVTITTTSPVVRADEVARLIVNRGEDPPLQSPSLGKLGGWIDHQWVEKMNESALGWRASTSKLCRKAKPHLWRDDAAKPSLERSACAPHPQAMTFPNSLLPELRFSDRVENYVRFRPGYPAGIIPLLRDEIGLSPTSVIADIGSGTGISTEMFLRAGQRVIAVEPNREMRAAAERLLAAYDGLTSVAGSAAATTLPDHEVDVITAAQAFHWFEMAETRREFDRILKPSGHVVLIWNERELDTTPFLRDYEQLLIEFGTDYQQVRHETIDDSLAGFFHEPHTTHFFTNLQRMDFEGIQGRLMSSSYSPSASHPAHPPMLAELRRIFDLHQVDGQVELLYQTKVHIGR